MKKNIKIASSVSHSSWHWKKVSVFGERTVVVRQSPVVRLFAPEYAQARVDVCRSSGCRRLPVSWSKTAGSVFISETMMTKPHFGQTKIQRRCGSARSCIKLTGENSHASYT